MPERENGGQPAFWADSVVRDVEFRAANYTRWCKGMLIFSRFDLK